MNELATLRQQLLEAEKAAAATVQYLTQQLAVREHVIRSLIQAAGGSIAVYDTEIIPTDPSTLELIVERREADMSTLYSVRKSRDG